MNICKHISRGWTKDDREHVWIYFWIALYGIIIGTIILFLLNPCFAEEPCDEKAFRIKYNQERISEIERELIEIRGWQSCLANERAKLLQQNQQLRQPEPEEK